MILHISRSYGARTSQRQPFLDGREGRVVEYHNPAGSWGKSKESQADRNASLTPPFVPWPSMTYGSFGRWRARMLQGLRTDRPLWFTEGRPSTEFTDRLCQVMIGSSFPLGRR